MASSPFEDPSDDMSVHSSASDPFADPVSGDTVNISPEDDGNAPNTFTGGTFIVSEICNTVDKSPEEVGSAQDQDTSSNSISNSMYIYLNLNGFTQPGHHFNGGLERHRIKVTPIPGDTADAFSDVQAFLDGKTITLYTPLNKKGVRATVDDEASDFENWAEYMAYCEQCCGKVTILFANTKDEDGNVVDWVRGTYSEKLLCDLSPFFGAIFNSDNNWLEARTRMIHFDDITIHDFNRLYSLMKVGGHSAVGDRDSEYVMSRLLRTHQLAERFLMPVVKLWVRRAMQAVIRSHKNWPAQYREQVVDKRLLSSDSIQRAAYHARKLIDMVGVYMHVKNNIPRHRRPLRLEDFIVFFVECVPHGLMMPVILRGELEEDFLREYLWQKLFRMDEIEGNALESL